MAKTYFVVQYQSDGGIWIDLDTPRTKREGEDSFKEFKRQIRAYYSIRFLKRIEEVAGIRVSKRKR